MRLLMTTVPSSGHFHQLVPIADAAIAAGHEVAFACAESMHETFQGMGYRTFAAGVGPTGDGDEEMASIRERARKLPPGLELDTLGTVEVIFGVRARRLVPGVLDACREWKPDAIVRDFYEPAGAIAADALGIPQVSVEITPLYDIRPMRDDLLTQVNRAREIAGSAAVDSLDFVYGDMHVTFAPPSLLDPEMTTPVPLEALKPKFFDRSGIEELPPWVAELPDQPTVYITAGTFASRWRKGVFPELLADILTGLRDEKLNVILTTGRSQDPELLGAQPSNVHVERYVPHTLVLPHCDLALTHGGMSCMMGAIEAGLPQVLVPLLVDDPFNARRCATLGLSENVLPDELTPANIRDAVWKVLGDPGYRERNERMRDELHALPGPEHVVERLEKVAA